jgi:GT2 family glycosyltransferase
MRGNEAFLISVVIPHWELPGTRECLKKLLSSIKDQENLEIVLQINEGIGFGASVNIGLRQAKGDYLIVANNDTQLIEGSLSDMPLDDAVSVPKLLPEHRDAMPRAFYCIPRPIYEKIIAEYGFWYDEDFKMGYWEDDDLIRRLIRHNIPIKNIDSVLVYHKDGGGLTMKQIGEQKYFDLNKNIYIKKWK